MVDLVVDVHACQQPHIYIVAARRGRGAVDYSSRSAAPSRTVASVDHRETPQQFDKMATADLYRDLLISTLIGS